MKSHRAVLAAVVAVGAVISTQCSSSQTSVPTAPGTGSAAATARAIGPTADATPQPGKFKVCKSANSNVSGSFTVDGVEVLNNVTVYKTPFVLAPGECYIVAEAQFRVPGASITVTETSAGFVGGTAVGTIMLGAVSGDPGDLASTPFASATQARYFNEELGRTLTFDNVVQVTGEQGCTPGYWGRPQHYDSWAGTGYSMGDDFDTTFGVNFFSPNLTLLEANNQGGGNLKALGRHAVAALLNASSVGVAYPYTTAQVMDIVQGDGVYAGLNVNKRKDLLEAANELGCPLN